ncbi:hypothetical protein FSP39_025126, partial [Pinctada imbricata]
IITGSVPSYVKGSLFRNGPAKYQFGKYKMRHLFDGMGAIQRWTIEGNSVTYQRKFVKSDAFIRNSEANRIVVGEFGTREVPDPCKNIFQRFFSTFVPPSLTDNTAVTVWPQGDRVFASTETHIIHEIDPQTLDTIGSVNLPKLLAINQATAHTHWTEDGTIYCIGLFYKGKTKHCVVEIPPKQDKEDSFKHIRIAGETFCRWKMHPGYIHSFSITENYFVYPEQTLTWSIPWLASMPLHNRSIKDTFAWYPNEKTIFQIISRKTGKPVKTTYTGVSQFTFHHVNAYEDNGHLILDITAYKNADVIHYGYMENFTEKKISKRLKENGVFGEVRRFVFPLNITEETPMNENLVKLKGCNATAKRISEHEVFCQYELLYGEGFELAMVNYLKYNGRKYKYAYGVGDHFQTLVKLNVEGKNSKVWKPDQGLVSEPIFIPNPEEKSEDDGIILSPVKTYGRDDRPYLIVLDGKTFSEVARVEFDTSRFSIDFHGFFRSSL